MSVDGLEPPGCPLPGVCACPGGEAEMAKRLAATIRERDAAIAQRDRAVAALKEAADDIYAWGQYAGDYFQDKHDLAGEVQRYKDIATSIADTPVPDRLAAEREAGRRKGFEEAAKVAEESQDHRPQNPYAGEGQIQRETCQDIAAAIRALRDTPTAPETGKTKGGDADG